MPFNVEVIKKCVLNLIIVPDPIAVVLTKRDAFKVILVVRIV